jgi:hypothetical protein
VLERAKKEGAVTLYTSMQLTDSQPLTGRRSRSATASR